MIAFWSVQSSNPIIHGEPRYGYISIRIPSSVLLTTLTRHHYCGSRRQPPNSACGPICAAPNRYFRADLGDPCRHLVDLHYLCKNSLFPACSQCVSCNFFPSCLTLAVLAHTHSHPISLYDACKVLPARLAFEADDEVSFKIDLTVDILFMVNQGRQVIVCVCVCVCVCVARVQLFVNNPIQTP